jgi:hypothetical protein
LLLPWLSLSSNIDKVPFVEAVCKGHRSFIPLFVSRLVAANQQHGIPLGIEGIQYPVGPATVLYAQLAHVRVPAAGDAGKMGKLQLDTSRASRSTE